MIIDVGSIRRQASHAFERGEGFPFWTIGMLRRGSGRIIAPSGSIQSDVAGTTVLIRPRMPYRLQVSSGTEETWAIIDPPPAWASLLAWPEAVQGIMSVPAGGAYRDEARQAFGEAERWWTSGLPQRASLAMNALERFLLLLSLGRPDAPWADLHPGIRVALAFMAPGPSEKTTIRQLASMAGMSTSYFSHVFARQIGASPLSWLEGRRIERARQLLLTTNLSLKSIALACGFSGGEHFSHRFRIRMRRSPSSWRKDPQGR